LAMCGSGPRSWPRLLGWWRPDRSARARTSPSTRVDRRPGPYRGLGVRLDPALPIGAAGGLSPLTSVRKAGERCRLRGVDRVHVIYDVVSTTSPERFAAW
jgi:hypothetical protein